jgi:hypothetical protein
MEEIKTYLVVWHEVTNREVYIQTKEINKSSRIQRLLYFCTLALSSKNEIKNTVPSIIASKHLNI